MDAREIEERFATVVAQHGPWTAHSIYLGHGVHTFPPAAASRLRRFIQIASDVLGLSLETKRVLDLACLEGVFGIEFALQGADVLGIEARETNIARARFAKEVLNLDNFNLLRGDVRELSAERNGRFDVVLCAGILYHLDALDAINFVERIADVCDRVAIIDTHISPHGKDSYEWRGHRYWGTFHEEHAPGASLEQKTAKVWYSVDNEQSFHFTRDSLCNVLRHAGFTSVFECLVPYEYYYEGWPASETVRREPKNRVTIVAIKGELVKLASSPRAADTLDTDRPERSETRSSLYDRFRKSLRDWVKGPR